MNPKAPDENSFGTTIADDPYTFMHTNFRTRQESAAAYAATAIETKPEAPPASLRVWRKRKHPDQPFRVFAYVDGEPAGYANFRPTLHGNDAMLDSLRVFPKFQRRGIARQLWEKAKLLGYEPVHSPRRTVEGDAFAKSVGGPTPPNIIARTRGLSDEEYMLAYRAVEGEIDEWYATRPERHTSDVPGSSWVQR